MRRLFATVLVLILILGCAVAQHITITDGTLDVTAEPANEGEAGEELHLTEFDLLGVGEETYMIYTDALHEIAKDKLAEIAAQVEEFGRIADASTMGTLKKGDKSEAARVMQQNLTDLNYLSGIPDGNYGKGTAAAVKEFQAAEGLPQTGEADVVTQLVLMSKLTAPVEVSLNPDPATRFAVVAGEVDVDLTPLYELNCRVKYDDIIGTGFITVSKISCENGETRDLDKATYTLSFGFDVDGNARTLTPKIIAECECLRRPVMRTLYIRTSAGRLSVETQDISSSLSGVKSVEKAVFVPDQALLSAFEKANEDIRLRIYGDYGDCDMTMTVEDVKALNVFAKVAGEL